MLDGFSALGLDLGPLREAAGTPDADDLVPAEAVERLWDAATAQCPAVTLPVALGLAIPYGAFGFTDYLAGSADTVAGGFESLALHLGLVARGIPLELERLDGLRWVRIGVGTPESGRFASTSMTAAILVGRFRRATNGAFQPRRVYLPIGAPTDAQACEALLRTPVECGAPVAALVLDEAAWLLPQRGADPYLRPVLMAALAASGLDVPGDSDLQRAIRARLRDALASGAAEPARIARLLGMSERTLQRRLAETGDSYSELLQSFRRTEAMRLLADTDLTLLEVAARLGYAEQTSFTRAFRRWSGATPAAWRAERRPVHRVGRIS